ncbi:hypothetical protein HanPSC8_Chr01g0007561 [Helianthus annuus]|nr:hypothetical protein HanPSC8_Chr01g0007561 [Helianthus annuus]
MFNLITKAFSFFASPLTFFSAASSASFFTTRFFTSSVPLLFTIFLNAFLKDVLPSENFKIPCSVIPSSSSETSSLPTSLLSSSSSSSSFISSSEDFSSASLFSICDCFFSNFTGFSSTSSSLSSSLSSEL